MNDVADVSVAGTGGQGGSPPPPASDRCPRCQLDLERCGRAARFCPRCGASRQAPGVDGLPVAEASDAAEHADGGTTSAPAAPAASPLPTFSTSAVTAHASAWLRLRAARSDPPALPDSPEATAPRGGDSHSMILLGYANALYRLGYRYETGLGSGRNPEEAIRCYFKAAKLGNTAALARLAPQCAAPPPPAEALPPAVTPGGPRS